MNWANLQEIADKQVLYLTTIGRSTGLPREIEIWFVVCRDRFICSPKGAKPPPGSRISGTILRLRSALENGNVARRRASLTARPIASCGIRLLQSPIANMDGATGCRWKLPLCATRGPSRPRPRSNRRGVTQPADRLFTAPAPVCLWSRRLACFPPAGAASFPGCRREGVPPVIARARCKRFQLPPPRSATGAPSFIPKSQALCSVN